MMYLHISGTLDPEFAPLDPILQGRNAELFWRYIILIQLNPIEYVIIHSNTTANFINTRIERTDRQV